ncbi:MAG: hypothetical protein H6739_29225 [Alphaproteobacteria bacterium]|nr:hypothetical protein [Alphaproteobacteria bacterium]
MNRAFLIAAALLAAGCADDPEPCADTGDSAPVVGDDGLTFTARYVYSAAIEGVSLTHGRPEFESDYTPGVFAVNHPLRVTVRMAWDEDGFTHPLYVGLVNGDGSRACVITTETISYGGDGGDPEDVDARTFVIDTHLPARCADEAMTSAGPLSLWVGANTYVDLNPALEDGEALVVGENDQAFLEEGNVYIFNDPGVDLSGDGRMDACERLSWDNSTRSFTGTGDACVFLVETEDNPGENIQLGGVELESAVGIVSLATTPEGERVCHQTKGDPLLRADLDVTLYGRAPDVDSENDLEAPVRLVHRICEADEDGDVRETSCDRQQGAWIDLMSNPEGDAPHEPLSAEDRAALEEAFGEDFHPDERPEVTRGALEAGPQFDTIDSLRFLESGEAQAELMLPFNACEGRFSLDDPSSSWVLESCAIPEGQDSAYSGSDDNCVRQLVELVTEDAEAELPDYRIATELVAWSNNAWGSSYGDSDFMKFHALASESNEVWTLPQVRGTNQFFAWASGDAGMDIIGATESHDLSINHGSTFNLNFALFGSSVVSKSVDVSAYEYTYPLVTLGVTEACSGFEAVIFIAIDVDGCVNGSWGPYIGAEYDTNGTDGYDLSATFGEFGAQVNIGADGSLGVGIPNVLTAEVGGDLDPLAYGQVEVYSGNLGANIYSNYMTLNYYSQYGDFSYNLVDGSVYLRGCIGTLCDRVTFVNKGGLNGSWTASTTTYPTTTISF